MSTIIMSQCRPAETCRLQIDVSRLRAYPCRVAETKAHGIGVPETHGAQKPRLHPLHAAFLFASLGFAYGGAGWGPLRGRRYVSPVRQPRSVATTLIGVGGWRYLPHSRSQAMANTAHGARTRTSAASNPETHTARIIMLPNSLSEPVVQVRRRGALPLCVTQISKARAQGEPIRLGDGAWLPADRIVITRNPDLTRSVECGGVYAEMAHLVETLRDVLAVAHERAGEARGTAVLSIVSGG